MFRTALRRITTTNIRHKTTQPLVINGTTIKVKHCMVAGIVLGTGLLYVNNLGLSDATKTNNYLKVQEDIETIV
jgi:hypothetical protein